MELKLLESIRANPKQVSELRTTFKINREVLQTFVRKGLVRVTWGPHGIGEFFAITDKGKVELATLKAASGLGGDILSRKLITVKHVTPIPVK